MNYTETMNYIKNTAKFGSNLGLERTKKLLYFLGNPHKKIKSVHIAGTNGKGSTTAMLTKILIEAGYKVGMYTSPYLEEFEERIQINGGNIPKQKLTIIIEQVAKAVQQVIDEGYDHPTEFEIITCAMFLYFYEEKVDYAVVEVGLGGRLDSTNVLKPLDENGQGVILSIITSISYDHVNVLGHTIEKIAVEKAGIIKENTPVVIYPQLKEVELLLESICIKNKCKVIKVDENLVGNLIIEKNSCKQHFQLKTKKENYEIELSLLGKHQLLNCATAIYAAEELQNLGLNIPNIAITKALSKVEWIGRLEVMKKKPLIVIDGAHNADGIERLKESITEYFDYNNMVLILGVLADKDVEQIVKSIVTKVGRVITVTPNNERAETAQELLAVVKKYNDNCEAISDYKNAYLKALEYAKEDTLVLISGSLYMIGDMRKIVNSLS